MDSLIKKHPLQRLSSPSIGFSAFIHFLGVASFGSSFKFLVDFPSAAADAYGWHFSYLTILGLTLATIAFVFGSLADITLSPRLFLIKNLVSLVATPLEVVISILYWSLIAIDPELVVPAELRPPLIHDIGFHAAPSIFLVIDLLFLSPPWTITILPTIGLGMVMSFAYWFWTELCYSKNGFYPYPIFDLLNTEQRIILFAVAGMIFTGSAISLRYLYGKVNGYGVNKPLKARPGNVKA